MPKSVTRRYALDQMSGLKSILVIGGTGMLGRPVTAALVSRGFSVRAMTRDVKTAAKRLPPECEIVPGDLRERESIRRAMGGMDAVYMNLSQPMVRRPPAWDPDTDGTRNVIQIAREQKVNRVLRISSLGVDDPRATWWVAKRKAETDRRLRESGVPFTIFRPNWFFESIAISVFGPFVMSFPSPLLPLHWIAAEDYAQQVVAALQRDEAANRIYECQGPEPITMREAARRFAAALGGIHMHTPMPAFALRIAAKMSQSMAYVNELLTFTFPIWSEVPAEVSGHELHRPAISLEDYAARLRGGAEWPVKTM